MIIAIKIVVAILSVVGGVLLGILISKVQDK